ncbi:MAG: LysR family transcriptional regulator [Clostridia bacterium]|nr:LysR family transcriptional regulator [Clostridia bacterium]
MMNITQLKYFHAVATYHTVSLAAQHLYISQPSLSNAIKELEKEFSVNLFYRRYNGMVLTPAGTKLYNSVTDLLSRYEAVEQLMRTMGKDGKQLRLGIPPMISSFILADIYKDLVLTEKNIDLSITEKGKYELLDQLNDGLLDVVLLPHTKPFDSTISAKKIGALEIVCCANKTSPISQCKTVDAKALAEYPLVLFFDTFFQTKTIKNWFANASVEPNVLLQTEQFSTAKNMIENNLAVGFMFKKLAQKNSSMVTIPLDPPITVDISVLRKKEVYALDCIKDFENYLQKRNLFV